MRMRYILGRACNLNRRWEGRLRHSMSAADSGRVQQKLSAEEKFQGSRISGLEVVLIVAHLKKTS